MVSPLERAMFMASRVTLAASCDSAGPMPDQWNQSALLKMCVQS